MKQMPWFRMYSDFIYDEKVEFLAFEDQRHYVFLLCMKNLGLLDKEYPKPGMLDRVVAKRLGLYGEAFESAKKRLIEAELIDEHFQPLGWDKRQFLSDSSTERVRAYRERTRVKQAGNVSVTVQETDTETDTEEETDTDKESRHALAPTPSPSAAQPSRTPKATRLPADWVLPTDWLNWALSERPDWTPSYAERVADQFRDYWCAKAGANARKVSWEATWRNWVRREKSIGQPATNSRPSFAQQRAQAEIDDFVNGPSSRDGNVIEMEVRRVGF